MCERDKAVKSSKQLIWPSLTSLKPSGSERIHASEAETENGGEKARYCDSSSTLARLEKDSFKYYQSQKMYAYK